VTGLYLKCKFHKTEIKYLELIIGAEGTKMDPFKMETARTWPTPKSVWDVRSFPGFANYYQRFIKGYSKVAKPLTRLIRNVQSFCWETDHQESFDTLGNSFTASAILRLSDDQDIVVETNISALFPPKSSPDTKITESYTQWPISRRNIHRRNVIMRYLYDKKLMAIVRAFEE